MKQRLVLKFGGSSVGTPEQIRQIAAKVEGLYRQGNEIIIVVSAMGKTTDSLMALAHKVSAQPNRRELDMLVSTGERVSMALMSMALNDLKVPSISFTGSQAGILTDGDFSNAKIIAIKPIRVVDALKEKKIVVLAGFQGVDPESKEITTLGRGGSDTTAVAMAAQMQAHRCEILKDVDGVYSADPRLVKDATLYPKLPGDLALDFCFWGAKVLHYRSVELACRLRVPLFVGRSDQFQVGTEIMTQTNTHSQKGTPMQEMTFEQQKIFGVNSHKEVHHISITATDTAEAMTTFGNVLREQNLPWPQILASAYENGACRFMYTSDADTLRDIRNIMSYNSKSKPGKVMSAVSISAYGISANDSIEELLKKLHTADISIEKTIVSTLTVTFFLDPSQREKAIQVLHG